MATPWVPNREDLRHTTRGLTNEQAARQTTASALCLGGLIKHVALTERQWARFIAECPSAMTWDEASAGDWMAGLRCSAALSQWDSADAGGMAMKVTGTWVSTPAGAVDRPQHG